MSAGAKFDSGFALVVGVGADLPTTVQDAEAIAAILTSGDRCAFPEDQVRLLTGEQAGRLAILDGLDWLAEQVAARDNATAIVYYSGHGLAGSPAYLLAHGYDLSRLAETAVSSVAFTERLRAVQSQRLVVLLDCCHAGAQADAKAPIPKAAIPIEAIESFKEGKGRVVIASSRATEYSFVGNGVSYFTEAVREALSGHGASELDGYCRVLDLAMYASQVVPYRTYDRQHPIVKVANLAENYRVAYYAAGETRLNPVAKGKRLVRGEGPLASQAADWQEQLDRLRGLDMELGERLRESQGQPATAAEIERKRRGIHNRTLELRGKLGLLPQQSEKSRSLTLVWTAVGLLSFVVAYSVWAHTQNWPRLPATPEFDYSRYAVAVIGILYGLPLVALTLGLTFLYQDQRLDRGLLNRLPIAFNLPFYADSEPRKLYQAVMLFLFVLFPLAGQVHFFSKMCRGTVYELVSGDEIASGLEHFEYFPFAHAFQGKNRHFYQLDGGDGGVTFYPFWQPTFFLVLELMLLAAAAWLFRRMARGRQEGEDPASQRAPPLEPWEEEP